MKSAAGLLFGCILTTIFFARCKKTWLGWRLGNETLHVSGCCCVARCGRHLVRDVEETGSANMRGSWQQTRLLNALLSRTRVNA